jgi:hypothetical protein
VIKRAETASRIETLRLLADNARTSMVAMGIQIGDLHRGVR